MNNGISAERKPKATRQQRPKLSKEEIKAFFDWRHAWLSRLFEHPEVKANPRLFMLGWFLAAHFDFCTRSCFPRRETIAEAIGVSAWSVTQLTRKLASMRFVKVKRRGRNDSAIYVGVIPSDARQEVGSTKDRSTNEAGKKLGSANLDVGLSQAQRLAVPNTNIEYEHRLEHIDGAHAPSEESFIEESADALEARPHPGGEEDSFTIAPDFSEIGEPPDWLNDVPPEDEEALERDEDDDDDVEESQALLDELGELPAGVDVNARGQLRAYLAGLNSAYLMRPRKVPNKHADNAETWLLGFDDFHNRRADGRLPLWLSF